VAAASKTDRALATAGLFHAYGESWVLQEIELQLEPGSTLAVIGANGAGKSTLLRILGGLLRPTAGRVEVMGAELPRQAHLIRARVGFLGHRPLIYRDLTVVENLGFGARLFGLAGAGRERIAELLELVSLDHRRDTRAGELSAGMLQRLAICRAVLHRPELLLLDEPLAHLDPDAASTVAPLIGPAAGRSRVLVTHDISAALADADQVLALSRDGQVAYRGPAAELDERAARAVYAERAGGIRAGAST